MLDKLWEIISQKESLIDEARNKAIDMLLTTKEMFIIVVNALKEEVGAEILNDISKMDKKINEGQQEIRKMIYEHLVISRGKDLLIGLQLTNIIIDLERIGDYTKNIGELVDMLPGRLDFKEFENKFKELKDKTLEFFDFTYEGLKDSNEKKSSHVLRKYHDLSQTCDGIIRKILTNSSAGDSVEKRFLGLVLLLRYIKRVNAHLKNIASSIVNPFYKIGYRM